MRYLLHLGLFILTLMTVTKADAQGRRQAAGREHIVRVDPAPAIHHHVPRPHQSMDFLQIADITAQWKRAVATHDRRGQWTADRRLDAWLSREIRESVRHPYDHRYATRLRALNNQLIRLERQHRGGIRGYYPRKARILDELVDLSAWQAKRARGHDRSSFRLSFAVR
jgi:hypothetical protein